MTDDTVVTIAHCKTAGLCSRGCRAWFAENGLDWNRFLDQGMTVRELRAPGCILAERAIVVAEAEANEH